MATEVRREKNRREEVEKRGRGGKIRATIKQRKHCKRAKGSEKRVNPSGSKEVEDEMTGKRGKDRKVASAGGGQEKTGEER